MNRRDLDKAILRAFGELDAADSPAPRGGEAAEQADRLERAGRALRRLTHGAVPVPPPAALRGRVLSAASAAPSRGRRPAWAAVAAAALLGVLAWSWPTGPAQVPPVGPPERAAVLPAAVYDDAVLDRRLADAADMAQEIADTLAGPPSWWDRQIESIEQGIEALGEEVTDPTATRPGGTLATTHPA